MRKGTAAAWIGVLLALAMAMMVLRQSQATVEAKPGNNAIDEVGRGPGIVTQQIVADELEPRPDVNHSRTDLDEHIRRTVLRSISSATLPSPPLPSRVMPGPLPTSEHAAPERQGDILPMPPVPSKTLPGAIPEGAQNMPRALEETEPVAPN